MSKFHNAAREKHPGRSRVKHILKGYKRGGAVHDDEAADRKLFKKMLKEEDKGEHAVSGHKGKARLDKRARGGGVDKFARGGRTKKAGGTHINIAVVSPNKKPDDQQQQSAMPPPPMPPMPPPPGGPMGGPPMPPPGGPMNTGGAVSTYASGGGVEGYDVGGGLTNEIGDPRRAIGPGGTTAYTPPTFGPGGPGPGGPPMRVPPTFGPGGPGPGGPPMRIPPGPPPHPMGPRTGQPGVPPIDQIGQGGHAMGGNPPMQIPPQIASYLSQFGGAGGKGGGAPIGSGGPFGGAGAPMGDNISGGGGFGGGPYRNPIGLKRGGAVKFTGGAESGEGRLEKAARQKRRG